MAWDGYFVLDGQEIINVARTEAYAADQRWFRAVFGNDDLPEMLGDSPYTTPALDNAPWTDPDVPESYDFFGLYPLDVTGIEDSSRVSAPVEYTVDGGSPGKIRHAQKAIVFNALLLGSSEKAVAYGASWLRKVTLGDRCNNPTLDHGYGTDLTFLSSEPQMTDDTSIDPESTLDPMFRTLRRFAVNVGPTVTQRRVVESCGGAIWMVTFTGLAGPFQYGNPRAVLQGYLDPSVPSPWPPGVTPGTAETVPTVFEETYCGEDTWAPIYDPLCPALVVPPEPPSVPLGCFTPPSEWDRRLATVPAASVPLWGSVAPVFTLYADSDTRNVRLRLYADPDESLDPTATPCSYYSDMVVSYIPAGGTLILDAARLEVWVVTVNGDKRRADSLVFTTEGRPFDWPEVSCGYQHLLTVDTPVGSDPPYIDLDLVPKVV